MIDLLPVIPQEQLNYLATVGAIVAPLLAVVIYYRRRYTRRKHIAGALIEEIRQNRYWAKQQQPHYDQHGIVGLGETFQFPNQQFSSEEEWIESLSKGLPEPRVVVPNYEAGDIPPSARASSKVYESTASEISRFNPDLAEELVEYYHFLDFVKELNDTIHEGRELPPAAYSILSDNMDRYVIENEDLVRELEIEMRRVPQIHRYKIATKEFLSTGINKISRKTSEAINS